MFRSGFDLIYLFMLIPSNNLTYAMPLYILVLLAFFQGVHVFVNFTIGTFCVILFYFAGDGLPAFCPVYFINSLFNAVLSDNKGIHSIRDVDYVQIQGLVANPSGIDREEFFTACRVHVDGGQQIAFLRCDKHVCLPKIKLLILMFGTDKCFNQMF